MRHSKQYTAVISLHATFPPYGGLKKSCRVRGQQETYILQRGDGGALPAIVRVPVHVQHLLPLHGHDPRQDAFLQETQQSSVNTISDTGSKASCQTENPFTLQKNDGMLMWLFGILGTHI